MKYLVKINCDKAARIIFLLVLICAIPFLSICQQFPSKFLSLEDGLPENMYRVVQNEQGYMWILSSDGIAKYNGQNFNFLTLHNGLPDNDVFNFVPDKMGRNWLMNNNNYFSYHRGDSIKTFDIPKKGRLHHVHRDSISTDISNGEEVFKFYKDDSFEKIEFYLYLQQYLYPEELIDRTINYENKLYADTLAYFLIHYDTYFRNLSYDLLLDFYHKLENFKGLTKALMVDSTISSTTHRVVFQECLYDNTLQFFTDNYHFVFDFEFNLKSYQRIENPKNRLIKTVLKDRNGDYWLVSKNGIYIIDKNFIYNQINWLPQTQNINVLGIEKYKNQFILFSSDNIIYSYDQFAKNDLSIDTILAKPSKKLNQNLTQIVHIEEQLFYVYSDRKIHSLSLSGGNKSKYQNIKNEISTLNGNLKSINNRDSLLFFIKKNLVGKVNLNTEETTVFYNRKSIAVDYSEGKTYLAGIDSMFIFDKDQLQLKFKYENIRNVIAISGVNYLIIDKLDQTLLCKDSSCEQIADLSGKKINDVIFANNYYWFIYNKGFIKASFDSVEGFLLKKDYQIAEILKVNQINDMIISDSIATIATDKGLFELNHHTFEVIPDSFPVIIESIETSSQKINYTPEIILPYDERSLIIHCSALSYKDNKPIQFRYKMKGNDEEITSTVNNKIRYTNLNPGKYEFEVFAINESGSKSDTKSFTIKIRKPWWQTYIFYFLCLLLVICGFWILLKRRVNKIQEKSRIEQKFAELELNALQSQMNPHFVFNAMSSMQNLIQQKDFVKSDSYLAKFSRLMRMYLESSKQKYVAIQDELEIIEIYFSLEKLRFQDKISLEIESKLSTERLQSKIPSSLIQPFIENAINHGLFHKDEPGLVKLKLYEKTGTIFIEIEDDGVGRAKSAEINRGIFKPKSRAISIIDDKIKAIKKMDNYILDYEIVDLYDSTNAAKGTKVIIRINS